MSDRNRTDDTKEAKSPKLLTIASLVASLVTIGILILTICCGFAPRITPYGPAKPPPIQEYLAHSFPCLAGISILAMVGLGFAIAAMKINRKRATSALILSAALVVLMVMVSGGPMRNWLPPKGSIPPAHIIEPVNYGVMLIEGWMPDGERLIVKSYDGTLSIWDVETGTRLNTVTHLTGIGSWADPSNVETSSNSDQLLLWAPDALPVMWDIDAGEVSHTLEIKDDHPLETIRWSPDGGRVAGTFRDVGEVIVWDATMGKCLFTLEGNGPSSQSVAWSPDGEYLATIFWKGNAVLLWKAETGELLDTLELEVAECNLSGRLIYWSPDGERLAARSCTLDVWDTETGERLFGLRSPGLWLGWSEDGEQLLTYSSGETSFTEWDAETGEQLRVQELSHDDEYHECFEMSPDGSRLAVSETDRLRIWTTLSVWDVATGSRLVTLRGVRNRGLGCVWSPDGTHLASTVGESAPVLIWELP
jgi:WD40 repeat protein